MNLNNIKLSNVQYQKEFAYMWKKKLIIGKRHCEGALVRPSMERKS